MNEITKIEDETKTALKAGAEKLLIGLHIKIDPPAMHDFLAKEEARVASTGEAIYTKIHHVAIEIEDEIKHFSIDDLKNLLGFGKTKQAEPEVGKLPVPEVKGKPDPNEKVV